MPLMKQALYLQATMAGCCPHLVRLQSKESKGEETRNREDGQKKVTYLK